MKPELSKHLIEQKFNYLEIAMAFLVAQRVGPLTNITNALFKSRPPDDRIIKKLFDYGIFEVFPGQEVNIDNVRIAAKWRQDTGESFEMAEELWQAYPGAFPLGGGGMFIARKGPDKHEVLKLYLERINNDRQKHEFVLQQLKVYVKLVLDQKINGHRIHDWISNEMWDTIPALLAASEGNFKTDI